MAPRIYESPAPPVPLVERSIFTHLLSQPGNDPAFVGLRPGSDIAFIDADTGTSLTRSQFKSLALSFAHGLRTHPQTTSKRGDTIMIYSPNSFVYPLAVLGAIAAGLRCTFANSAYTARELAYQYTDSGAHLLCAPEECLPIVREMFRDHLKIPQAEADKRIIVLSSGLSWAGGPDVPRKGEYNSLLRLEDLLTSGAMKEEEKYVGVQVHETVFLCYSSGTTGKPKGVETTHRNLTFMCDTVNGGGTFPPLVPSKDKVLAILPFYHIFGAVKLLLYPLLVGATVVIQPRFEPVQFCANIEKYNIKLALIVPPIMVVLARHPAVDKYNMSSIDYLVSGAAPLGGALVQQVINRFASKRVGKAPLAIVQGYGLTETSPTINLLPPADTLRKIGSIGTLLPNLQTRLVDEDDVDVPEGERGELWVRGPNVMKGYLNNPTATKDSITPDGWFKTGDVALIDKEGYYYIVDRRKELIKYKGFQVPPAELESVLLTHSDIADTAVIGVDNAQEATEVPRAYVVHAHPESVKTEEQKKAFATEVVKWMETKVARHKFLRGGVGVIDVIPKSAAGKILRRELREKAKLEASAPKAKL